MSNTMKYIRDLEAAGFRRDQAEAQVQMVLDVLEGDLVTKSDFATFQAQTKSDFTAFQTQIKSDFASFQTQIKSDFASFQERFRNEINGRFVDLENKFVLSQQNVQIQIKESEFRMTTRLGFMMVSTVSIAVAVLTWLVKA